MDSTSNQDKVNTTAHLLQTTGNHLSHTHRHAVAEGKSITDEAGKFNHEHMMTHLEGAIEHVQKLTDHLNANYPKEAKELKTLEQTVPRTDEPTRIVKKMSKIGQNQ
jgi:hypothetical protein